MDAIATVRVSSRGQLVIPEDFRKSLGIGDGERMVMIKQEKNLILKKQEDFLDKIREKEEWGLISGQSLSKVWGNKKDDEVWSKY